MPSSDLALDGGTPVRTQTLPYGRQSIDEADIQAVVETLRSDFLTTGPAVARFEAALAEYVGAKETVALANGTAALHAMMAGLGVGPGDEVIVPSLTFAASANSVAFCGGTPVFAEVRPEDLCLDPDHACHDLDHGRVDHGYVAHGRGSLVHRCGGQALRICPLLVRSALVVRLHSPLVRHVRRDGSSGPGRGPCRLAHP